MTKKTNLKFTTNQWVTILAAVVVVAFLTGTAYSGKLFTLGGQATTVISDADTYNSFGNYQTSGTIIQYPLTQQESYELTISYKYKYVAGGAGRSARIFTYVDNNLVDTLTFKGPVNTWRGPRAISGLTVNTPNPTVRFDFDNGDWRVAIKDVQITTAKITNQPPVINSITVSPSSGEAPLAVGVVASASDPDGDTVTYTWNMGDGSAERTGIEFSHIYETAGDYTARLTVTDGNGGSATQTRAVTITAAPLIPPVAHWEFNDDTQDFIGTNHGVPYGGPTYVSSQAINLDGTNDYVSVADSAVLDLTSEGTISFWLNADQWSDHESFLRKADSAGWCTNSKDDGFNIFNNPNGRIYLSMCGSTHNTVSLVRPALGTWNMYAFTWDGTELKVYLNGDLETTNPQSSIMVPNNDALLMGKGGYWSGNWIDVYYDGAMDDTKIWDQALSASEIVNEYNSHTPPALPNPGNQTNVTDTTPPVISVTHSPQNPVVGQTVTLNATASDNVAVDETHIWLDDIIVAICQTSTCSYSMTYNSTGTHTYLSYAYDSAQNAGRDPSTGTYNFTVQ